MKISRYNKILKTDKKDIIFNSFSCALAEINDDFYSIINNIDTIKYNTLNEKEKELVNNMLEGNYILQDEVDEYKNVKYRHLSAKFAKGTFALTIAPTLDCNFACPYCYENSEKGIMSIDIQDDIISIIEEALEYTKIIEITWYGGEPLLAKDTIIYMSNKIIALCKEQNVEYRSSIITNGYLLDQSLITELIELKVNNYQITIDGPPNVHNERRRLRGEKKDTFYKILENVKELKSRGIKPNIRINVDNTNEQYINDLLNIFQENNLNDLNIYFGHVKMYSKTCKSVSNCMQNEDFAKFDLKHNKILKERGFNLKNNLYYPQLKSNYCGADSISSYVIDPNGYMYKCWNEVGNQQCSVGNVKNLKDLSDGMYSNNVNYILWSPFEIEKCKECWLLPICMGGCPNSGLQNNGEPECEKWKYIINESLINIYNTNSNEDLECNNEKFN